MLNKKVNVVYYNGGFIDEEMLDDMSYEDIDVFVLLELELNPSEVRLVEEMPSLEKGSKLKVEHYERYGKLLLANCIDDNNKEHLINTIFLKPLENEIDFENMTKGEFIELFEEGKVAVKSDTFEEFKNILNDIYEFSNCKEEKYEDDILEDIWNVDENSTCVAINTDKDFYVYYWLAIHLEDAKSKGINITTYNQFKNIMNNQSIEEFVKELKANAEKIYRKEEKIFMNKNNFETVAREFTEKISKSLENILSDKDCNCETIPFDEEPLSVEERKNKNLRIGDRLRLANDIRVEIEYPNLSLGVADICKNTAVTIKDIQLNPKANIIKCELDNKVQFEITENKLIDALNYKVGDLFILGETIYVSNNEGVCTSKGFEKNDIIMVTNIGKDIEISSVYGATMKLAKGSYGDTFKNLLNISIPYEENNNKFEIGDAFKLKENFGKTMFDSEFCSIGFMKGDVVTISEIDNENLTIVLKSLWGETVCVPMGRNGNKFIYLLDISTPIGECCKND